MAYVIPETATRLQATAFVEGAALNAIGRESIIRESAKQLARNALDKLLRDCVTIRTFKGEWGNTLDLDVYVMTPNEVQRMAEEAYIAGRREASRWMGLHVDKP